MPIQEGENIPSVKLKVMVDGQMQDLTTDEIFKGKKVVLFAVPGAFTPTCSAKHLPSFVANAEALKAKGIDAIYCLAVNDAFVMDAWAKDQNAGGKVTMLADGSGNLTNAMGMELDLTARGLGMRGQRFSMVVNDGKVEQLFVEAAGAYEVSSAEHMLANL